jgi:hypothetical protein
MPLFLLFSMGLIVVVAVVDYCIDPIIAAPHLLWYGIVFACLFFKYCFKFEWLKQDKSPENHEE